MTINGNRTRRNLLNDRKRQLYESNYATRDFHGKDYEKQKFLSLNFHVVEATCGDIIVHQTKDLHKSLIVRSHQLPPFLNPPASSNSCSVSFLSKIRLP